MQRMMGVERGLVLFMLVASPLADAQRAGRIVGGSEVTPFAHPWALSLGKDGSELKLIKKQ